MEGIRELAALEHMRSDISGSPGYTGDHRVHAPGPESGYMEESTKQEEQGHFNGRDRPRVHDHTEHLDLSPYVSS